jgi:hypothetical protein
MCRTPEYWSTVLLLALICTAAVSGVLQHGFLSLLQKQSPSLWRTLGKRRVLTDDGDKSFAAAQWYLITGEYKTHQEPELVTRGDRARIAFLISCIALFSWGAFASIANASPRLACLLGVSQ